MGTEIHVNSRTYALPAQSVVAICLDGCSDEQLAAALASDAMPNLKRMSVDGSRLIARGALPSFTNVNNSCIVTGAPPSITGIAGNFFLDPDTGEEVMMNSSSFLRCETILAAAQQAGRKVAMITAKEKLRNLLSKGLEFENALEFPPATACSTEKANEAAKTSHGLGDAVALIGGVPPIYSPEASLAVLRGGLALLKQGRADFLYLTTTDYMQHKFAPESPELVAFYAEVDRLVGEILATGAIVGITADHGMNAKMEPDGQPNVVYVESLLNQQVHPGVKVICPITDPYVVHHGALGSLVYVHTPGDEITLQCKAALLKTPGVTEVYTRQEAVERLELPEDRIGDLVVLAGRDVVLGKTPEHHDLSVLSEGLRSHGGRYEEMVPMILSTRPGSSAIPGDLRNFDLFKLLSP